MDTDMIDGILWVTGLVAWSLVLVAIAFLILCILFFILIRLTKFNIYTMSVSIFGYHLCWKRNFKKKNGENVNIPQDIKNQNSAVAMNYKMIFDTGWIYLVSDQRSRRNSA